MKTLVTSFEAVEYVFNILRDANITLSGNIYQMSRPINSSKEDIVINTLALSTSQFQNGVINVNIYVPNLELPGDLKQPNKPRLKAISNAVLTALDDVWGHDYNLETETTGEIMPDESGQWFMNIRVRIYALRVDV